MSYRACSVQQGRGHVGNRRLCPVSEHNNEVTQLSAEYSVGSTLRSRRTCDGDGVEVRLQVLEVEREVEDVHISDGLRHLRNTWVKIVRAHRQAISSPPGPRWEGLKREGGPRHKFAATSCSIALRSGARTLKGWGWGSDRTCELAIARKATSATRAPVTCDGDATSGPMTSGPVVQLVTPLELGCSRRSAHDAQASLKGWARVCGRA